MSLRKKILLIQPPFYRLFKDTYSLDRYPLSLGYLAAAIRKNTAWDVMVYNADFSEHTKTIQNSYVSHEGFTAYCRNMEDVSAPIWNEVRGVIREYKPDVVGLSATASMFGSTCISARIAKELNPRTTVILGGAHVSTVGADVLSAADIDIGVRGEGEYAIVELLHAIERNKEFDTIAGVLYRTSSGIRENAPRPLIENLDSLGSAYEYVEEVLKDYSHYPQKAFKNIMASRGCSFNCFFCGSRDIWTRRVRYHSPEWVAGEIQTLYKKGIRTFRFDDDTFCIDNTYLKALCSALIRECPRIKWACEMHASLVNAEALSLMKQAGCFSVQLGIESGNNDLLQSIRKGITAKTALTAARMIKACGLELEVFFQIGFPDETEKTLCDTLELIKKIPCDEIIYSVFTPYPGTEAFMYCQERGLISAEYDISLYHHQSRANCFTLHVDPDRFRAIADDIERIVDKRNRVSQIRRLFTPHALRRAREAGFRRSLRKGIELLFGT